MINALNNLKNWPKNITESINKKEILVISEKEALNFIHGKENQNKISFYISNDKVHVGILTLTEGKFSDVERHNGDEAIWVLQGEIQIKTWKGKDEEESVFQECYHLKTNDKFMIPEGYNHQYFNLSSNSAKILFAISPDL
ncbi:MAG: cupin domain-containing protein [Actinobacteria bacterium]|nr:cupin domain-containing protein [Actinomycetota bacterium]